MLSHSRLPQRIDGPESVNLEMVHRKSLHLAKYDNYPNIFENAQLRVKI